MPRNKKGVLQTFPLVEASEALFRSVAASPQGVGWGVRGRIYSDG